MAARDRSVGAGRLSFAELEDLWKQAGGDASLAPTMAAIALAESGGNVGALNDTPATGDYSVGLWQINYYGNLYSGRAQRYGTPDQLRQSALADARAAVDLAAGGRGLGNWSTYNSGAYRQYLGGQAAGAGRGPRPSSSSSGGGGVLGFLGSVGSTIESGAQSVFVTPWENAWNSIAGGVTSVFDVAKAFLWLANPVNWLRAFETLVGFVLILVGLFFLGRTAGSGSSSSVGSKVSTAATLVPGVGPAARAVSTTAKVGKAKRAATATRRAKAASSARREARAEEHHKARVSATKALASQRRAKAFATRHGAKQTKSERERSERSAYIRGATDAAAPNLAAARRRKSA